MEQIKKYIAKKTKKHMQIPKNFTFKSYCEFINPYLGQINTTTNNGQRL